MSARTSERLEVAAHRTLPHSLEAEQGVLGSMLLSPSEAIAECMGKIGEEHFYIPANQTIYLTLIQSWQAGKGIDLITFTQFLRDKNVLDAIGGASYVTSLYTLLPTAANLAYYLEIVREKYILRQIIAAGTESVRRAYEEQDEVNGLLDDVLGKLTALALESRWKDSARHVKEGVDETINRLEIAFERRGEAVVSGLATGLFDIDRRLSGLKPGQMIVVAARPSHGKTALAMNIAEHVAVSLQVPVGVFSMEMSYQELVDRMVLSRAQVSLQRLRDGFLSERDFPGILKSAGDISSAGIYIDDTPALAIYDLKARGRRLVTQKKVGLLVVDYLQLMRSPSRRGQDNRALEIGEISGGLKALAKELAIPVIVLAQLNRDAEKRSLGKPKLSDLRESGTIEQDADIVGLLTRPIRHCDSDADKEYAAGRLKIDIEDLPTFAELNIAKQRNGPVGEVRLRFIDDITRFQNMTGAMWSNNEELREKPSED